MINVFFPNQKPPEWLQKQVSQKGYEKYSEPANIKFTSIVMVFGWKGNYRVINLLPKNTHMSIIGGKYMTVQGQSPKGGNGDVIHYRSLFSAVGL